nr:MAG: hypothetical protein DiTV3a_F4ORF2 [Diabrotica toursvirus 3a]
MENLGGYIEDIAGGLHQQKNIAVSPEISFQVDMNKSYEFLENYLNDYEFNLIKSYVERYNYKLFKNPSLILISFIIIKFSTDGKSLEPKKFREIFSDANILPLIQTNNITQFDLLRYCRYIIINKMFLRY